MAEWVTQLEAAELLGVHRSVVPKMLRRGDLAARRRRPSLSRDQVLELAAAREAAAEERQRRRMPREAGPHPPDAEQTWLLAPAAAAVMGCSAIALTRRAQRGRVPSVLHGGRRWFRLDHLELLVRAEVARQQRQPMR